MPHRMGGFWGELPDSVSSWDEQQQWHLYCRQCHQQYNNPNSSRINQSFNSHPFLHNCPGSISLHPHIKIHPRRNNSQCIGVCHCKYASSHLQYLLHDESRNFSSWRLSGDVCLYIDSGSYIQLCQQCDIHIRS